MYYKCPVVRTTGADHLQTFEGFVSMSFPSHGLIAREHHLAQISVFRDPYTLNNNGYNNDNHNNNRNIIMIMIKIRIRITIRIRIIRIRKGT